MNPRVLLVGLTILLGAQCFAAQETTTAPPATSQKAPRLDVLFVVDTTGSMSDEIQVVKDKVREMVAKIASGKPTPEARFGLVLYRDRGDAYVTKTIDLTAEIDDLVKSIKEIEAGGGGDYAESVVEALHVAVNKVNWSPDPLVEKTMFVILDAPPHLDYTDDFDYKKDIAKALDLGIIVNVIGCSGLADADAQFLEKNFAKAAEGTFNALTYKRTYADAEGRTTTVLESAGRTYAMKSEPGAPGALAADWRAGADRLAAAGAAAAAPAPTTAAPGMPGASGPALAMAVPAAPPAVGGLRPERSDFGVAGGAPGAAQVGATENNLDSILVGVVQRQAERRGVRYEDTGKLEILARFEGVYAAAELTGQKVIRDAKEWEALWKSINAGKIPVPELPAVDFTKNMILATFLGTKPTSGYGVHIESAWTEDKGLRAEVWTKAPAAGSAALTVVTQPYSMVVVPRQEGEVRWVKIDAPKDK